jgi:hypothetical protein
MRPKYKGTTEAYKSRNDAPMTPQPHVSYPSATPPVVLRHSGGLDPRGNHASGAGGNDAQRCQESLVLTATKPDRVVHAHVRSGRGAHSSERRTKQVHMRITHKKDMQ